MIATGWVLTTLLLAAGLPLERVELKVAGRVIAAVPADINGDGQADVLVFWRDGVPPEAQSRVSVFLSVRGRVSGRPVQVLRFPADTVAFDVGDTGGDGRDDLLRLTRDGVWAHAGQPDGRLRETSRQVVEAMTVAAFPHEDHVPRVDLLIELDDRGERGLMVPTVPIGPLSLYTRDEKKGWILRQVMRVPTRSDVHTAAEDFRSVRDFATSFRLTYPRWQVTDQNGDGRRDLVFFSQDTVAIFRRRPDGGFPATPDLHKRFAIVQPSERLQHSLIIRGEAGDVNGDGRVDLLFNKTVGGISNMKSEVRLYLANASGEYPSRPDFESRREGWGSSARLVDVDGDGRADLVRPHVEMGVTTLIGMMLRGRLDVTFEVYLSKDGSIDGDPHLRLESPLNINFRSSQELQGPYPIFTEDFDGDGNRDLVLGRAGGGSGDLPDRLEIRPGLGGARFEGDATWHTDLAGTRFVVPFRNGAGRPPGLLIYFSLVDELRGDVWVLHNPGR